MRCAVVGAGAWGTALADLLARNEHEVSLWAYEADVVESIKSKAYDIVVNGSEILLGSPFTFTKDNVGQFDF